MDFDDDTLIWPALQALSACLCEELESKGLLPGECFCGVLPGEVAAQDYDQGQAWVRLVDAYPYTNFPNRDTTFSNCGKPLAFDVEVGVTHCYPTLDSGGRAASQEQKFEAARLQLATMAAMRRAILCCTDDLIVVLGSYTPIGPNGNLVGGQWTVTLAVD